jgi:hypothetical protein
MDYEDYTLSGDARADAYAEELAEMSTERVREIAADGIYPKAAALAKREAGKPHRLRHGAARAREASA